jgi:energy-coupling factor transport system permease protein
MLTEMDAGIKMVLAIFLTVIIFLCHQTFSLVFIAIFLLCVTAIARINFGVLVKSILAYGFVIVMPYLFGFLINALIHFLADNGGFVDQHSLSKVVLKMFQLFLLWYIGSLYLHTTPLKSAIGMLDKFFTPLKALGVPITEYLKVVMCVIKELAGTTQKLKNSLGQNIRSALEKRRWCFKINLKGIANILVSLIVNSFREMERIQDYVEKVSSEDLYSYHFKITGKDTWALGSFGILLAIVLAIETNYFFR